MMNNFREVAPSIALPVSNEEGSLQNYDSNHAVVMLLDGTVGTKEKKQVGADSCRSDTAEVPSSVEVNVEQQSGRRSSLYLSDSLFDLRNKVPAAECSFMSSVTLTDCGAESFFNDSYFAGNSHPLLRWDDQCNDEEDDSKDEFELHTSPVVASSPTKAHSDGLPKFPQRRCSLVSGKVSVDSSRFRTPDIQERPEGRIRGAQKRPSGKRHTSITSCDGLPKAPQRQSTNDSSKISGRHCTEDLHEDVFPSIQKLQGEGYEDDFMPETILEFQSVYNSSKVLQVVKHKEDYDLCDGVPKFPLRQCSIDSGEASGSFCAQDLQKRRDIFETSQKLQSEGRKDDSVSCGADRRPHLAHPVLLGEEVRDHHPAKPRRQMTQDLPTIQLNNAASKSLRL